MDLHHLLAWGIFLGLVLVMLAVDLFVLHRKPHVINFKEALIGALIPVAAAMLFIGALYWAYETHFLDMGILDPKVVGTPAEKFYPTTGGDASLLFLTGYLVELSLSADNVFLFILIMNFFKVPRQLQHNVLFWGVLGALVMRAVMILLGVEIIRQFHYIIYLFGAFLIFAGVKLLFSSEEKDPSKNFAVRALRKLMPIHDGYEGKKFFTRINGRTFATSLFVVLVCIEFTDLVFALDSIPAIFGITLDSYIIFTSNVFAILGLRSMYFLLAGVMDKFHLLKYGLAVVLAFVGVKMLVPGAAELYGWWTVGNPEAYHWHVDRYLSLGIIAGALTLSILASLVFPSREKTHNPLDEDQDASPSPTPAAPTPELPHQLNGAKITAGPVPTPSTHVHVQAPRPTPHPPV
jgi:tellurite resistance protein TerC